MMNLLEHLIEQDFEDTFEPASEDEAFDRIKTKFEEDEDFQYEVRADVEGDIESLSLDELEDITSQLDEYAEDILARHIIDNMLPENTDWVIQYYIERLM